MFPEIKCIVFCDRNIRRVLTAFIMHLLKTSVWIFVIIWNRNDICVTIFIRIRSFPDTFQAIPHTRLVWQEHCFNPDMYVIFQAVFHLD